MLAPNSSSGSSTDCDAPVFVIGYYRSGTSLLHALLNRHQNIRLLYESDILKFWPVARTNGLQSDWEARLEFWNKTISRHKIHTPSSLQSPQTGREAAMELYERFRQQTGAEIYGAKSAVYHDCLLELAELFPKARFVIIWRSPLEILRSIRRAGKTDKFFSPKNFDRRMVAEMKKFVRDCRELVDSERSVCEVRYQDLTDDPHKALRQICKFLGTDYQPEMADLTSADTSVLPPGIHHDGVRSGRIHKQTNRKELLSSDEIAFVSRSLESLPGAPWLDQPKPLAPAWKWTMSERLFVWKNSVRKWITQVVYAKAPLSLLLKLRSLRTPPEASEHGLNELSISKNQDELKFAESTELAA